jgi:diadenylate cyclase
VQLPLAEAGAMDGIELGSRHRAAMGITVGSDATCLVVSEETGTISAAQNGQLNRSVTESGLRKCLSEAMGEMAAPSFSGIRGWLGKFTGAKAHHDEDAGKPEKQTLD